ncbi:CHASE2 domain-containing protein [Allocoleopsis franciscana]|uniref:Putative transmembrane sensor domain protein n=1 Tax=Allocoleopsis franciscana PCC 7113 TaxID=1173027 RepID=K9WMI5_9CYAN|nr:CHASE2 domain-containing protein [Allocoleopsis franciscana]AFZ21595.1 putative transmembrane sensor domain protein [Allocoleopsis franciscana PCC 7113]
MFNNLVTKIRSLFSNENGTTTGALAFGRSVILTSVVVAGVVVGLRQIGTLEGMELRAYDQLMRSRPDQGPDDRLLVVGVTEQDIQTRKEYPIKDDTLAQLLAKLQQYQPRTIGIDILRDVPQGTPQGRIALEKILKQDESIIAGCKMSSVDQPGVPAALGVTEERVGFADLPIDAGGILRRSLLLSTPTPSKVAPPVQHLCNIPDPENQIPSFGFQLALLYLEGENIQPDLTPTGELKIGSTVFHRLTNNAGSYHNAGASDYQIMLNYRSPKNAVKQVSVSEVLDGKIDPSFIKDRVVLIGYTTPIAKDDFYTPYSAGLQDSQKMPGVVIHAQHVSQILSSVLNNRPLMWCWSEGPEMLWILGWSVVGGLLAWRIRRLWLFGLGVVVGVGVLYGTAYVLFLNSGWVPLIPPMIGLVATAIVVVLIERGYAKAIYQGVKKLVLNIEIDEEKKRKQVEAITETESFAELQQKAAELRKNRQRNRRLDDASESNIETNENIPTPPEVEPLEIETNAITLTPQDTETPASEEDNYFQQLQQRGKKLKTDAITPTPQDAEAPASDEDNYFQQLQKRGRRLRKNDEDSNE